MLKIEHTKVTGWEAAIRGMRNPYDSWEKSDSCFCPKTGGCSVCEKIEDCGAKLERNGDTGVYIGPDDLSLMDRLVLAGDCHAKFARMIIVTADITGPLYWWKQFDTYKVGTVADSCSTMHTIMKKQFEISDFSFDKDGILKGTMPYIIQALNNLRYEYKLMAASKDAKEEREAIWNAVIQLLPESYNQKRTVQLNYQALRNMYTWRKDHKLDEWHTFCDWIEHLPYSELITTKRTVKCQQCGAETDLP